MPDAFKVFVWEGGLPVVNEKFRVLGIRAIVYPTIGDWPYRYYIEAPVPEILAKTSIVGQSSPVMPHNIALYSWVYP